MRILTRYLLRAHLGPFLFALTTLTGLLFLNAVAQELEDLTGKGLSFEVVWEFMVLSLPHIFALTLPMAVLVAVLYAFSELAANNEVTAMKAGGIQPQRLMLPLVVAGVGVGALLLYFNDSVLPETNHRLRTLTFDINRKTPTLVLREQVVNEIRTNTSGAAYYLKAAEVDNVTNQLFDVYIHDGNDPRKRRTTYADSGQMAFNAAKTDLYLTLYDGVTVETQPGEAGGFKETSFEKLLLPLRGVANQLERENTRSQRSDREMTLAMLDSARAERAARLDSLRIQNRQLALGAVRAALGLPPGPGETFRPPTSVDRPEGEGEFAAEGFEDPLVGSVLRRSDQNRTIASAFQSKIDDFRVEYHKKLTLAFACVVFVLVGAPLAIRFPRGGLGLVIAASTGIFAIYWAGLIGGENLVDEGAAPPALTMWAPNIVFTAVGLWLFLTMGRESATSRGGGWEDLFWTVRKKLLDPFRRRRSRERPARAEASS